MKRVILIGCSGAGKSTLGRRLAEISALPLVHLDRLWWRENWTTVSEAEFDAALAAETAKEAWIIDGNYNRTLPQRLERCDTVVYLDYPRRVCLLGALKRIWRLRGQVRPDMSPDCPERFDWEFLCWIWNFNLRYREKYLALLAAAAPKKKVVILRSRAAAAEWLQSIAAQ